MDMTAIRQKFQEKQYKFTPQRQTILQAFADHGDRHLSAEEVHGIVKQKTADIGLATVYRTLEILSELDVLQKIDFGDGRNRYEVSATNMMHHHHHLICLSCHAVKEFEDDLLETLECAIAKKSDFLIVDHHLKFYGYCQDCRTKHE